MQFCLRLRLKLKKENKTKHHILELNQSQWSKPFVEFNTQGIEAEKYADKDGKTLHKLMNNPVYGKTVEDLRTDVKLLSNKKGYLKWTSKPSYLSQNIFDNNFVAICKTKLHEYLRNQLG